MKDIAKDWRAGGGALALLATALIACSAASPQGDRFCETAKASKHLPVTLQLVNEGSVLKARFDRTLLPRPDGRTAVILTDLDARVQRTGMCEAQTVARDIAYNESVACRDRTMRYGFFACWDGPSVEKRGPLESPVASRFTRAFLSVTSFLASGGESDTRELFDDLADRAGSFNATSTWYLCQACGGARPAFGGPLSMKSVRFGRTQSASYIITKSGWTARLEDGSDRAEYRLCPVG